jgi:hypothetical protein
VSSLLLRGAPPSVAAGRWSAAGGFVRLAVLLVLEMGEVRRVPVVREGDGFAIPLLPDAGLVAGDQDDRFASRVEREDQPELRRP